MKDLKEITVTFGGVEITGWVDYTFRKPDPRFFENPLVINDPVCQRIIDRARFIGVELVATELPSNIGARCVFIFAHSKFKIEVNTNPARSPFSLKDILAHELGHVLGIMRHPDLNRSAQKREYEAYAYGWEVLKEADRFASRDAWRQVCRTAQSFFLDKERNDQ